MKFFFEVDSITDEKGIVGRYYKIKKGSLELVGEIDFGNNKSPMLVCAYVCQLIAEGGSLPIILRDNIWCPSLVVFHATVKEFWEVKVWYDEALKIRETLIVEKLSYKLDQICMLKFAGDDKLQKLLEDTKLLVRDLYNYYRKKDRSEDTAPVNVVASLVKKFDFGKYK